MTQCWSKRSKPQKRNRLLWYGSLRLDGHRINSAAQCYVLRNELAVRGIHQRFVDRDGEQTWKLISAIVPSLGDRFQGAPLAMTTMSASGKGKVLGHTHAARSSAWGMPTSSAAHPA